MLLATLRVSAVCSTTSGSPGMASWKKAKHLHGAAGWATQPMAWVRWVAGVT